MTEAAGDLDNSGWLTAALAEELRAQLARKRMSGRELARRLHVSAQWVSQRTRGDVPLRMDEIERICDALQIGPAQLLQGVVTESGTRRYRAATSHGGPLLTLVAPLPAENLPVAPVNGSSPDAPRCDASPDATHTAEGVHLAYTA